MLHWWYPSCFPKLSLEGTVVNMHDMGWHLKNRGRVRGRDDSTFVCLSQARTWISNVICHGFLYVQWVKKRRDCSFCWYWWPSLFKIRFHKAFTHPTTGYLNNRCYRELRSYLRHTEWQVGISLTFSFHFIYFLDFKFISDLLHYKWEICIPNMTA
jgi:hypothetical protein